MSKVLIVESEPWLVDHYQRTLERQGFAITRASNAYSAMDSIDDNLPDAVLMNVSLSGASSIALLHELQAYTDTGSLPIIVCGNTRDLTIDELQPYGVRRLVDSASMRPDDLVAAVRSVLL